MNRMGGLCVPAMLVGLVTVVNAQPLPVAPPVDCGGVRPGAVIETSKGFCTMNFVFQGNNGATYVGTAGHCILGDEITGGQDVGEFVGNAIPGDREALDGNGNRIGDFDYAILESGDGVIRDFSLVRLDPGVSSNPAMCHFGGPTATNGESSESPDLLHHYGAGLAVGEVLPARTHVAIHTADSDQIDAIGAAIFGDSGSGVLSSDGRAIGVLVSGGVAVGIGGPGTIHFGTIGITRIAPQLGLAESALGIDLTLETAPF